jgi:hypothetical protein
MVNGNNPGKLISFPVATRVPGPPAENWSLRILETKDNLKSAVEILRIAYNDMVTGKPVKTADEILAQVAILMNDEKRTQLLRPPGSMDQSRKKRRKVLLFPAI